MISLRMGLFFSFLKAIKHENMKDIEFSLEMLVKLHLIKLLTASPYRQHISRMSSISNGL